MITFKHKGNFNKSEYFLTHAKRVDYVSILTRYGDIGLRALESATPKDTGLSANSWSYKVNKTQRGVSIEWSNSNKTPNGTPIVILIQYGHATGDGGYVQGEDFINPAIKPVFDDISEKLRKEVSRL